MKIEQYKAEVEIELDNIARVVTELQHLAHDMEKCDPTLRDKTAAGAFLSQFYMGVENILKHTLKYHGLSLPTSAHWHIELFQRFCEPPSEPLPVFFDEELAAELKPYRRFWHLVHHGYGFDLKWELMQKGIAEIGPIFQRFRTCILDYLDDLA